MADRILIVDDDPINREILQELLADRYEIETADSGEACLERLRTFEADVVLLDIMMPGMGGYETCRRLKRGPAGELVHVIFVSAKLSIEDRLRGYECGADDYLTKPFDHDELLAKIGIQFRFRHALWQRMMDKAAVEAENAQLEGALEQRSAEVIATQDLTVFALAKLAESRDPETGAHLERIRSYCQILAENLAAEGPYASQIDTAFLQNLYRASPLHDIGKVGIPDVILLKPGRLTTHEFEIMQRHTLIGAAALEEAADHLGSGGFLEMASDVARSHHERFDGSGYPDGLNGLNIPLAARIVAVADVFDALTSTRVYKAAYDAHIARAMIEQDEGKHFDPVIVKAFRACYERLLVAAGQNRGAEHEDRRNDPHQGAAKRMLIGSS